MLRQMLFDVVGSGRMTDDFSSTEPFEKGEWCTPDPEDLVLCVMRLAERAHRTRDKGPHHRKAPEGEDRSKYFIHLTEVAWVLQEAGYAAAVIAAGFLHDLIEDCGYTQKRLAREIGNDRVAELVAAVSEADKGRSWEERNEIYLNKMKNATEDVLALSCADKTSNLRDMNRLLSRGHAVDDFTSRNHSTQLRESEGLDPVYRSVVPAQVYRRFSRALAEFRGLG